MNEIRLKDLTTAPNAAVNRMPKGGRVEQLSFRKAKPGDCFLLFVPSAEEHHALAPLIRQFQDHHGGRLVPIVHLTCQRFSIEGKDVDRILDYLSQHLCGHPFPVIAHSYAMATSRFNRRSVLHWQLNDDSPWYAFREQVDACLKEMNLTPQYTHLIKGHFTLLYEINDTPVKEELANLLPQTVFEARTLKLSQMNESLTFDELGSFELKPCAQSR